MPTDAAASTCAIVTPVTALTSSWPTPRSGGMYRSNGIMTKAPPAPSNPATNAPQNPTTSRVTPSAMVTGEPTLPEARIEAREVGDLLVGERLEERLQRLERLVARAPPVRLEEEHLVLQVTRRLPCDVGNALGWVALARGRMAADALAGRRAPALDGRGIGAYVRRPPRLAGEVRRDLVHAELEDLFRIGFHLGRKATAGRVVVDGLLQIPRRHAREDRHHVRRALAALTVTRAAHDRLRGARRVERPRRGARGDREHDEHCESGPHRLFLSAGVNRARRSRCWSPTRPRAAPTARIGRASASARSERPCRRRSCRRSPPRWLPCRSPRCSRCCRVRGRAAPCRSGGARRRAPRSCPSRSRCSPTSAPAARSSSRR